MEKQYIKLGFALTPLKPGTKDACRYKWNINSDTERIPDGYNIGLKHLFSRVCVLDIDDLKALKKSELWKVIKSNMGIRYTSGKKNRLKILYRMPRKKLAGFVTVDLPKGAGQIRSASKSRKSYQDALPPSRLNDGRMYCWIDPLPLKRKGIPKLPEGLYRYVKKINAKLKAKQSSRGEGINVSGVWWIDAFNEWFVESGQSFDTWMSYLDNDYEKTAQGYRRIGSSSENNMKIYHDIRAFNYSTDQNQLLPHGPLSPWDIYVAICGGVENGGIDEAKRLACGGKFDESMESRFGIRSDVARRVTAKRRGNDKGGLQPDGTFTAR